MNIKMENRTVNDLKRNEVINCKKTDMKSILTPFKLVYNVILKLTVLVVSFCGLSTQLEAQTTCTTCEPLSQKYVACNGASVTIGFQATSGITYYWYTQQSGGTSSATGNTITATKNSSATQTWWVEPRSSSTTYARIRVDLELGANCGITSPSPSGCFTAGTLLFKEDLGGNDLYLNYSIKKSGISQVIGYTYTTGEGIGNGEYSIRVQSALPRSGSGGGWGLMNDHTSPSPSDDIRGYLLHVNATNAAGQFYERQIDNLCPSMVLYISY
jgi:hypothetical protein